MKNKTRESNVTKLEAPNNGKVMERKEKRSEQMNVNEFKMNALAF